MVRRNIGFAFSLAVVVLRPLMMALTKRDWRGVENIPSEAGCLFVVNHLSEVDPLVVAHFTYDNGRLPRFLAKVEVFKWPVVGRLIAACGQIPVYRRSIDAAAAFSAAVDAVNRGECVIVYAEGTLTRDPDLWPMVGKTGAARIALATGCPVIPVAQWGSNHILAPYAKRPHVFPRKIVHVSAGPAVDLSQYVGQPLTPKVLRAAMDKIMADVVGLLEEIRGETAPAERYDPRVQGVAEIGNPYGGRRNDQGEVA